jgi:hypothetical protein
MSTVAICITALIVLVGCALPSLVQTMALSQQQV